MPLLFVFRQQLVGLFDEVDEDHDGYMHYTEFIAATLETGGKEVAEERLADAFNQLDTEETHHISKESLVHFLGRDAEVRARVCVCVFARAFAQACSSLCSSWLSRNF